MKSLFGLKWSIILGKRLLAVFYNMDIDRLLRKYLILDKEERSMAWITMYGTSDSKCIVAEFQPILPNAHTASFKDQFRRTIRVAHKPETDEFEIVKFMLRKADMAKSSHPDIKFATDTMSSPYPIWRNDDL